MTSDRVMVSELRVDGVAGSSSWVVGHRENCLIDVC